MRMTRRSGILILLLVVCAPAREARAQAASASANDPWELPFLLALNVGLGTPTGFIGAEGQWNPSRYFGLAAGAGTNADGLQVMIAMRPRFPLTDHVALTLSGSWSMGPEDQVEDNWFYIDGPAGPEFERHWAPAHWASADAGVEVRYPPVSARSYLGVSQLINVDDFGCTGEDIDACESSYYPDDDRTYEPTETYPYLGVSIGVVF
jgi:hypothetical protein